MVFITSLNIFIRCSDHEYDLEQRTDIVHETCQCIEREKRHSTLSIEVRVYLKANTVIFHLTLCIHTYMICHLLINTLYLHLTMYLFDLNISYLSLFHLLWQITNLWSVKLID